MNHPLSALFWVPVLLAAAPGTGPAAAPPVVSIAEVPCGWPARLQADMLEHARRLMPAALARQVERHRRALLDGARRAARHHAAHVQRPLQQDGTALALADSVARITALLDARRPMAEVVREMGRAGHLVADLSNPFRGAPDEPAAAQIAPRFADYLRDERSRFRVVFEGYGDPLLAAGEVSAYGMHLADQSRSYLDDLLGGFRRYDTGEDPGALDDRSVPFGVASLTYSRSITDTARVWLHAWRQAHGDLTGLPFHLEDDSP
ncbi:MAG: hypothetical protein ACE5IK_05680 [Acidobacteriota bacterium]